jgi:hypothetical protein
MIAPGIGLGLLYIPSFSFPPSSPPSPSHPIRPPLLSVTITTKTPANRPSHSSLSHPNCFPRFSPWPLHHYTPYLPSGSGDPDQSQNCGDRRSKTMSEYTHCEIWSAMFPDPNA